MTAERRLLVALAAALAPERVVRLVGLLSGPEAAPLRAEAVRLAAAPRQVRLAALERALAPLGRAGPEGPRLVVRWPGAAPGPAGRPSVPRTEVRAADGPGRPDRPAALGTSRVSARVPGDLAVARRVEREPA